MGRGARDPSRLAPRRGAAIIGRMALDEARPPLTGGCLCGRIRYQIDGPFGPVVNCHCTMCRKAQGVAFATNAAVARKDFRLLEGQELITEYESSEGKLRCFCRVCARRSTAAASTIRTACVCASERWTATPACERSRTLPSRRRRPGSKSPTRCLVSTPTGAPCRRSEGAEGRHAGASTRFCEAHARKRSAGHALATRSGPIHARSALSAAKRTRSSSPTSCASLVSTNVTRRSRARRSASTDMSSRGSAPLTSSAVPVASAPVEDGVEVEIDRGPAANHPRGEVPDHAHRGIVHRGHDALGLRGPIELEVVVHRGEAPVEAAPELRVVVELPAGTDVQLDAVQEPHASRRAAPGGRAPSRAARGARRGRRPTRCPRRDR